MTATARHRVHMTGRTLGAGQRIHQGRLTHTRMTQKHRHLTQQLLQKLLNRCRLQTGSALLARRQTIRRRGQHNLQTARRIVIQQVLRVPHIGLRNAQNRLNPGVKRRYHGTVNEAGARLRVRRSNHNHQLLSIRHDHALRRVGVIGATAQNRGALAQTHNARQGILRAGGVTHQVHKVAGYNRGAA